MAKMIRWGFMGCGTIASDFANSMQLLPKNEHEIVAVAARDLKKAKEFGEKFNVKHAFEGYEKVANCPDVDIVYVNVINSSHLHCVKLALNSGKSVLCETPLGMNTKQVREMTQLAKQKGVFFMEAFWSRCFPIYEEIRQALKDGRIGEPKFLQGLMGIEIYGPEGISTWHQDRPYKKELCESTMLTFGNFLVMLTTMLFDGQRPESIKATGQLNSEGMDEVDCVTLKYKDNAVAQLMMSAEVITGQRVLLFGTKGSLEVPERIYAPDKVIINSKLIEHPLPDTKGVEYNYPNFHALSYEIQHVRECLLKVIATLQNQTKPSTFPKGDYVLYYSGLKESPLMSWEHTDVVVSIMDEIRRQVGCVYPDSL